LVRLAERMADITEGKDATVLVLLAAAYAANGEFDRAVTISRAALDLKPADSLAAAIRGRQELYRRRQTYVLPR
jgi:Flp pilus assembly protein TadD